MAYCTETDVTNQIGATALAQLTDINEDLNKDTDVVADAITKADTVIDFYLSYRYDVPLTSPPDIINIWATDIAVYELYKKKIDSELPSGILVSYNKAIEFLSSISQGRMKLPCVTLANTATNVIICDKAATDQIFQTDILDTL